MGFAVDYVADIQRFPTPLYPRFKHNYRPGTRIEIPATVGDTEFDITTLFYQETKHELIYVVVGATVYEDKDCWDIIFNDTFMFWKIQMKDVLEKKHIRPVRRFMPKEDNFRFIFHNNSGTAKTLWLDFECVRRNAEDIPDLK